MMCAPNVQIVGEEEEDQIFDFISTFIFASVESRSKNIFKVIY